MKIPRAEEEKHSRVFKRFLGSFARQTGIETSDLLSVLPVVSGTVLQRTLQLNSEIGGHAFWWVLTLVEEVSILIFKQQVTAWPCSSPSSRPCATTTGPCSAATA